MASQRSLSQAIRDGGRFYFDDPSVDQVLAMLLTLSGEVWALRERLAAFESVAALKGLVAPGELDGHDFGDAEALQLAAQRKEFLAGLFGILEMQKPPAGRSTSPRTRAVAAKRGGRTRTAAKASRKK